MLILRPSLEDKSKLLLFFFLLQTGTEYVVSEKFQVRLNDGNNNERIGQSKGNGEDSRGK